MPKSDEEKLARYYDDEGRLTLFPAKRKFKDLVLQRLVGAFEEG